MQFITPRELLDWGLIFEINRTILHPFGLAIMVEINKDNGMVTLSNKVWDCREDPEGLLFENDTYFEGLKKFKAFLEEQGNSLLEKRSDALGYVKQEIEEVEGEVV